MGIATWIALGAAAGCIAGRIRPIRPPGGTWAAAAAGMAGGFVGGGTAALAAGADPTEVAPPSVLAAIVGAALLVLIIGRAARAQPRAERSLRPAPARPSALSGGADRPRAALADPQQHRSGEIARERR
jgi:uncharacterized membrane protein YeaQ/YmgE (transglycosylase-associated protein family)